MSEALKARIADVFNEPGCDKNVAKDTKDRKKGCSKPLTPGAAAGGCAFDGAKIALQPLTDVVHLVHGPLACEGNGWDNRHASSSGSKLYRTGFTTDMTEMDIVMGNGEKRLYRAIKEAIARHNPPAIFVYATCVPAVIGDDIEAVCKHATEKLGTPCIPINAPGFAGSKNLGNKLAGEALLDYVIGTIEPEIVTDTDINILGEYNLSGELWQILPLLDKLGIRVQSCVTGDAKFREVASSHRVRLNMMVCSTALINVARKMEQKYGIPYFEGSFYGISDTSDALRMIAGDAGRTRRRCVVDHPDRRSDSRGGSARLGADRTVSRCAEGQAGAAVYRRGEVLVDRCGFAGNRHGDRQHVRAEIH